MAKRFQNELALFKEGKTLKFTLGVLACIILAVCIMVVSAFTVVPISHYYLPPDAIFHPNQFWNVTHNSSDFIISFGYVPQIPVIAGIAVILGKKYGFTALLLYVLTGIFFVPVFSLGGGIRYIFQYGFGYVLGFFPMIFVLMHYLRNNCKFKNTFLGSLFSVVILHLVGMIYLILICAIRHDSFGYAQDLIHMMTTIKIVYDFVFTFIAIYIANIIRKILWLAMD